MMAQEPDQAGAPTLQEPASALPPNVVPYKRTPEFTEATVPSGLLAAHSTKQGVWGRICISKGELVYRVTDPRRLASELVLSPGVDGIVEPTIEHEVRPNGPVIFAVEFLRVPQGRALPDNVHSPVNVPAGSRS